MSKHVNSTLGPTCTKAINGAINIENIVDIHKCIYTDGIRECHLECKKNHISIPCM